MAKINDLEKYLETELESQPFSVELLPTYHFDYILFSLFNDEIPVILSLYQLEILKNNIAKFEIVLRLNNFKTKEDILNNFIGFYSPFIETEHFLQNEEKIKKEFKNIVEVSYKALEYGFEEIKLISK